MLGTRGVPASYSGFETCVEELGSRLVKLPTIANKYLDTLVHSFVSSVHALFQPYDICLYFIAGNSLVTWIPRLVGKRTIINVDGLDWKREKWPELARKYIRFA